MSAEQELPDPLPGTVVAAVALHEMFSSFLVGGFTEDQALRLTAYVMTTQGRAPDAIDPFPGPDREC